MFTCRMFKFQYLKCFHVNFKIKKKRLNHRDANIYCYFAFPIVATASGCMCEFNKNISIRMSLESE